MKVLPAILKSALFLNFALMAAKAQVYVYVSPNDIESAEASGLVGVTPTQVFTEHLKPCHWEISAATILQPLAFNTHPLVAHPFYQATNMVAMRRGNTLE